MAKLRVVALCGQICSGGLLRNRFPLASLCVGPKVTIRSANLDKRMRYEKLELEADQGTTLGELEDEIDRWASPLSDVERDKAWLYAWALRKRQESRTLTSALRVEHDGDAGLA